MPRIIKTTKTLLLVIAVTLLLLYFYFDKVDRKEYFLDKPVKQRMTIATVSCGSRFEETLTQIKSALIFGKNVDLNFIVFVDDKSGQVIQGMLENLQKEAREYDFRYEIKQVQFPPEEEVFWKSMLLPCATQRLFFPEILPLVDSLLYMDSDTLFLSNVRDLWSSTERMSDGHYIAAMAPEDEINGDGWYNLYALAPYYGKRGLNSGVMLMNLTRMREIDFVSTVRKIQRKYGSKIAWGDQGILNIYFYFHPEKILELGCEYNFRAQHCDCRYDGDCSCRNADKDGAKIIHGNRKMFHSIGCRSFRNIYNVFRDFQVGSEKVEHLLQKLEDSLENLPDSPCSSINENRNFFNHIRKYLSS